MSIPMRTSKGDKNLIPKICLLLMISFIVLSIKPSGFKLDPNLTYDLITKKPVRNVVKVLETFTNTLHHRLYKNFDRNILFLLAAILFLASSPWSTDLFPKNQKNNIVVPFLFGFFIILSKIFQTNEQDGIFFITKMRTNRVTKFIIQRIIVYGIGTECINETIGSGRSYVDLSFEISDCSFTRLNQYTGMGGVIYVNGGTKTMTVFSCMFYSCSTSSFGGAIFFMSSNSVLKRICANKCSASSRHFAYIQGSINNTVEYLSVSFCSQTTTGGYPIFLIKGIQLVLNTNSSMNQGNERSGLGIQSPDSFICSYCTFSNNKVLSNICIGLISNSGTISFSNIVHNNSPSSGVITVTGSYKMDYCIFSSNQNTLFQLDSGSLDISHCMISHSSYISIKTSVLTSNNNTMLYVPSYQMVFLNSHYCFTDIPPPTRTIMMTIEETSKNTIDCTIMPTFDVSLINTIEETLDKTHSNTIDETLEETPMSSIEETFEETPMKTIQETYGETSMSAIEETNLKTTDETLIKTLKETLMNTIEDTLEETPLNSIEETSIKTTDETLIKTFEETLVKTIEETNLKTTDETLMNTNDEKPEETPMSTTDETQLITHSQMDQFNISRSQFPEEAQDSTSMAVVNVMALVSIIIGITIGIGFLINRYFKNSENIDSDSNSRFESPNERIEI